MSNKNTQLVKVYIRQRPFSHREVETKSPNIIKMITSREITIENQKNSITSERKFTFDEIFNAKQPQVEIYLVVVSPLIESIISGCNCTVFAYGQTGTGKTHTMVGTFAPSEPKLITNPQCGFVLRAADQLFTELNQLPSSVEYTVRVSFIEIHNEDVRDLLVDLDVQDSHPLRLYEDPDNRAKIMIHSLTDSTVCNTMDVSKLLDKGTRRRQTAVTVLNRICSHTVFTITVFTRDEDNMIIKTGKLSLVDLASSENVRRAGVLDKGARDAANVNKSLLTLGKVIKALTQKNQHVPYRESKLTRILQDSLGGKAQICIIGTISPATSSLDETLSTLDYASDARNVINSQQINTNGKDTNMVNKLNDGILTLKRDLANARTGDGFCMSIESYEEMQNQLKEKTERLIDLVQHFSEKQEYISLREKDYEDTMTSFEQTKLYLNRIKRERNVLYDCMVKQDNCLMKTNAEWREICKRTTNDMEAFHNKYNDMFDKSVNNQMVLNNLECFVENCSDKLTNLLLELKSHKLNQLVEIKDLLEKNCSEEAVINLKKSFGKEVDISQLFIENGKSYNLEVFEKLKLNLIKTIYNDYDKELRHIRALFGKALNGVATSNEGVINKQADILQTTIDVFSEQSQLCNELQSIIQSNDSLITNIDDKLQAFLSNQIDLYSKLDKFEIQNKKPVITEDLRKNKAEFEQNNKEITKLPLAVATQQHRNNFAEKLEFESESFYQNVKQLLTGINPKVKKYNDEQATIKEAQFKEIEETINDRAEKSQMLQQDINKESNQIDYTIDDFIQFNYHKLSGIYKIADKAEKVVREGDTPVSVSRTMPKLIDTLPEPRVLLQVLAEDEDVFNATPKEWKL